LRVLGLLRVHNGGDELQAALDSLAGFCDDIYALNDRSIDETADILAGHPLVTNVVTAHSELPVDPWVVPESAGLQLLYRMADFCRPEWIVMIDHDQVFHAEGDVRRVLAATSTNVVGLTCPIASVWNDAEYPRMVPLMGTATGTRLPFWRYFPGLHAGVKPLHNLQWPTNLQQFGRLEELAGVRLVHSGWDTLAKRIGRVNLYQRLDPDAELNFGKAYDRSLLFGYALEQVEELKSEYWRRVHSEETAVNIAE
jgi:hypothetical protein